MSVRLIIIIIILTCFCIPYLIGQQPASIKEEQRLFRTYSFGDPDPVPILDRNPAIYPYFKFDGYSHTPADCTWTVVTLENEYIQVYVIPEVGGKVWGAIEKSTGKEFIYRNEVMKFRNIAMRGPWTSGGIEFNFGIIGHHPSTATPVDYVTRQNQDGSVSCIVGNIDLPSRTQWRVEIRLPRDASYFETRVLWYNPTSLHQPYYNWMTAAAKTSEDLEFFCPGNLYLDHPGNPHPWPVDRDGRKINLYGDNDFGGSKSYHVVGTYQDFFGGYYQNEKFGFGHWAPYEEMPGQKLWLWAQSRSGAIWEDLLTDSDGQYIEFQAGRLFNQFSPGLAENPISQVDFEPGRADLWRELWFPIMDIGGMTEVSDRGVLHINSSKDSLIIGINAFHPDEDSLIIVFGNGMRIGQRLSLTPLQAQNITLPQLDAQFSVRLSGLNLHYAVDELASDEIDRPFTPLPTDTSSHWYRYQLAAEHLESRQYRAALEDLEHLLAQDPFHLQGLVMQGDIAYRQARYDEASMFIQKALRLDTYDPKANLVAAQIARAQNQDDAALEYLGWAGRSLTYRAESYAQMAGIYFRKNDLPQALKYARNALDFNKFHIKARRIIAMIARITGSLSVAAQHWQTLETLDPLSHFVPMERFLLTRTKEDSTIYLNSHRSEFPYQTMVELAAQYLEFGRKEEALSVLDLAPQNPLVDIWWTYLNRNDMSDAAANYVGQLGDLDYHFYFPFRRETLPMLEWSVSQNKAWQLKYLLALQYWSFDRLSEAWSLLDGLGREINDPILFLARAALADALDQDPEVDLQHAVLLNKRQWRSWYRLTAHYLKNGDFAKALLSSEEAFESMPDQYSLGMQYAEALVNNERYEAAIDILDGLKVLPFEGASQGHKIWVQAHIGASLSAIRQEKYSNALQWLSQARLWPENLGVGKPYQPDERRIDYLETYIARQKSSKQEIEQLSKKLISSFLLHKNQKDLDQVLLLKTLETFDRDEIIQNIEEEDFEGTITGQWINAVIQKSDDERKKIEENNPQYFVGLDFTLLKHILDLP